MTAIEHMKVILADLIMQVAQLLEERDRLRQRVAELEATE
jgi:hypothetical protein